MTRKVFPSLPLLISLSLTVFALIGPAAAHATPYYYEVECFNSVEKCWATDFTPNSGYLGGQSRDDDLNSLPTFNGSGLWYGGPSLNSCSSLPVPATGGDYPWGGGDIFCGQKCAYPKTVSCNAEPSQFVTQNYTDTSGGWHFAMGGGNQCRSDGKEVPCNVGHRMYPYDCAYTGYSSNCVYTSPQDMPFTWGFPENMYFQEATNLFVGGAAGPWHAFLCTVLRDAVNGAVMEFCDEPWNSTGNYQPVGGVTPCTANSTFGQYWQRAGESTPYMTTYGTPTSKVGTWIGEDWTMNRGQFINLLRRIHGACPTVPLDEAMDNWKLYYSENGIEEIGAAGKGAGITFEIQGESMATNY